MTTNAENPIEIQLQLLATAYFYGDYSIIHHFVNKNSFVYNAMLAGDLHALQNYAENIIIDSDDLTEQDPQIPYRIPSQNQIQKYSNPGLQNRHPDYIKKQKQLI